MAIRRPDSRIQLGLKTVLNEGTATSEIAFPLRALEFNEMSYGK